MLIKNPSVQFTGCWGETMETGKAVILDVDGTIVKEEGGPKHAAIQLLQHLIEEGIKGKETGFPAIDRVSQDELSAAIGGRSTALTDREYWGRSASSPEEAAASPLLAYYAWFEYLKKKHPQIAKAGTDMMSDGVRSGTFVAKVFPDVAALVADLIVRKIRVGTYSGGAAAYQAALLGRSPAGVGVDQTLADIIGNDEFGAGFFDAKGLGDKMKSGSYKNLNDELERRGLILGGYVTDGIGEAQACAKSAVQATVLIDRSGRHGNVGSTVRGIYVVRDLGEVTAVLDRKA